MISSIIKFILITILVCGAWYLIGVFLSNEWNLFLWPWYGKIVYLIFAISTLGNAIDSLD